MVRIGGSGGYGDTVIIKNVPVVQCAVSGYSTAQIEHLCSSLQPAAMAQAGQAFTNAGHVLATVAEGLIQHAQRLSESWAGTAAQAALANFQQLHQSAVQLAQASTQTGSVLSWLGDPILPYYKSYRAPGNGIVGDVEALLGHNPQQIAAQQHLARLNDRLTQANGGLPDTASVNLPPAGSLGGTWQRVSTGSGGTGGGTAGPATGGLAGGGAGPAPHATGGGGGGGVSGGGGGVSGGAGGGSGSGGGGPAPHLIPPPVGSGGGVGALPPGGGAGTGTGMGGMLPAVGGGMAVGAVGLGGAGALRAAAADGAGLGVSADETAAVGPDGMVGSVPGSGAAADQGAAAAGADEIPMGAGADGDGERERMRQSWMGEDPSTWDEAAGTVPPTVGI